MAQYFISAEDYALGDSFNETPFEATTSLISISVVEDSGRKAFRIQMSATTSRRSLKLNHGLVMTGFCEVFVLQRGNADSDYHWVLFANGAGANIETGITINTYEGSYRIAMLQPSFSALGSVSYATTVLHNSLFRSNGVDDHKVFLWDEGEQKPSTPSIDISDAVSFSGDNLSFLTAKPEGVAYVYSIGIGTDGDPAPTGTVPVGPTTPTSFITSNITANSFRAGWTP